MKKTLITAIIFILNFATGINPTGDCTLFPEFMPSAALAREAPALSQANINCQKGDKILNYYTKMSLKSPDKTVPDGEKYLTAAKYFYYQANRLDISNINAFIGRARIALLEGHVQAAKNNLMIALNISELNPRVNYWLGEAFFTEGEFAQAIKFYYNAYSHGFKNDYSTNLKLGICYEKLDDAQKAKLHYKNAIKINKGDLEARAKLQGLDTINTNYEEFSAAKAAKEEAEAISPEDIQILNTPE